MSQKTITSFFTKKSSNNETKTVEETKKIEEDIECCDSSKENVSEEDCLSSPVQDKRVKRKRAKVIYSDNEEEDDSPLKNGSPPKKKALLIEKTDNCKNVETEPEENSDGDWDLPIIDNIALRKTAPREPPFGCGLRPGILKVLEECKRLEQEKKALEKLNDGKVEDAETNEAEIEKDDIRGTEEEEESPASAIKNETKTEPNGNVKEDDDRETPDSPEIKKKESKGDKSSMSQKKVTSSKNEKRQETKKNKSSRNTSDKKTDKKKSPPSNKEINSFFGAKKPQDEEIKVTKDDSEEEVGDKVEKKDEIAVKNNDKGKKVKPVEVVAGADYKPSKGKYHPIDDAFWKQGEKVPYLALARTFEEIEAVSARLKMIEILSNYFRSVMVLSPDDLLPSVYLCLNKLAPAYHSLELGIAEHSLMKAIAQSTGRSLAQIKSDVGSIGDLGLVAEQSRSNQRMMFRPSPLTVRAVFDKLKEIAQMTGHASMSKKMDKIQAMFIACRQSEARFVIRSLAGKLRIGLAEQSVLQALSLACVSTPPCQEYPPEQIDVAKKMSAETFKAKLEEEAIIIKTTYCECPNYDLIVPVILKEGVKALPLHCRVTPGIPLKPMLAQPTKGAVEVLQRFDGIRFTCEWKYDGERAQIHLSEDGKVSIFSRNQEDNTSKYPDIISKLATCIGPDVKSCILDTESVAWDKENKRILPFQVLSTRKKKDCNESDIKVPVCVYLFDLLYLNGESLVKKPLVDRRKMLYDNFKTVEESFMFATSKDPTSMEELQNFLENSVKGNCEGLMVKTLESDATYEIAKRSRNWLKLKKDYLDGVGDTLDLVVVGGYLGRGKRVGMYGGFLLACYDPEGEDYQSICKIGTGFSDEDLQQHSEFFKQHLIDTPRAYYRYDKSLEPDHWFDAVQVWEVKCADLSLSPIHRAATGIVDPDKGISLRFPRFIRVRDDKPVEEATSAEQVADMYRNQDQIKNQGGTKISEEDFY